MFDCICTVMPINDWLHQKCIVQLLAVYKAVHQDMLFRAKWRRGQWYSHTRGLNYIYNQCVCLQDKADPLNVTSTTFKSLYLLFSIPLFLSTDLAQDLSAEFFTELEPLWSNIQLLHNYYGRLLSQEVQCFNCLNHQFEFMQLINKPTHGIWNWLDLIILVRTFLFQTFE